MKLATPRLRHKWSIRKEGNSPPDYGLPPDAIFKCGNHPPSDLLNVNPVDLLFVEYSPGPNPRYGDDTPVEGMIARTQATAQPKVVLEAWGAHTPVHQGGPASKLVCTRWQQLGYHTHCQWLAATQAGGAVSQTRLMVVRVRGTFLPSWSWTRLETGPPRPMSNLLTPPGRVPRWAYTDMVTVSPPYHRTEPMPSGPGRFIRTEEGIRRLEVDEFIRGLGGKPPDPPVFGKHPLRKLAEHTTSLFHWEYLLSSLVTNIRLQDKGTGPTPPQSREERGGAPVRVGKPPEGPAFQWAPPSLQPGSPWHCERVANLQKAAETYPDPEAVIAEGMQMLERHRLNYDKEGPRPTRLQLLWWEWPKEHWEGLRQGSAMNFLTKPRETIHENSSMDPDQLKVAGEFVDELISLGTLAPLTTGEVLATAPLFCIPKEGQPGQWRVIADMLRGGQNGCIGNDPVFLPRALHIQGEMYEGGYSAVVDASKFFYQFSTHPEDRPYLGIKHPITGDLYAYYGLPMGSGNSPALGSRYGLAFVRALRARHPHLFQGKFRTTGFLAAYTPGGVYRPEWGDGFVIETGDGPAIRIWAFVDDFLIHAHTKERCEEGLSRFLDLALDCGMLCHPKKLVPPQQSVRYCGLIFSSNRTPTLIMPQDKKERAMAMIDLALYQVTKEWSRLALSVLAGVLESLAECTPQRIGHTYLRSLHSQVHPEGVAGGLEAYLSVTRLRDRTVTDLGWWRDHLREGEGRVVRARTAGALVPTFGDGSGTGTGGTILLPDAPLTMWKGQWAPAVFSYSSNWKELTTLLLTLEHIKATDIDSVRDTTVFYFTDNSATYWICNKGSSRHPHLHEQVVRIRALESQLACHLVVIHIPGKVIIQEGTDGLSRGVWITPLQETIPRHILMPAIFSPTPFDPRIVETYLSVHVRAYHQEVRTPMPNQFPRWHGRRWDTPWDAEGCFNRMTIWFPPPEVARAVISFILNCQVEVPLTTSALFFIPRVLAATWRGLSRKLVELQPIDPITADLAFPPTLPIPVTVLYLPEHTRRTPTRNRLDRPPVPRGARWHQEQADQMRRVFTPAGG